MGQACGGSCPNANRPPNNRWGPTDMPEYEIYAISYARNDTRTSSENFLGGDLHDVPMPMSFYVWAIVGNGRTYLLDTGFDATAGQARGRTVDRPIDAGLKAIGINP